MLITRMGLYPYPSVVAFAFSEDLSEITFAIPVASQEYLNLDKLPHVTFIANNYNNDHAPVITAFGISEIVNGSGAQDVLKDLLLTRHPNLKAFVEGTGTRQVIIHVEKYQVVTNFEEKFEFSIQ
ncbi:MAG: hypothetical protein ACTSUE_13555 [Promethearchaeota archaeon]